MTLLGRTYVSGSYRYGFNGKGDDKNWGTKHIQDYGFRLYNPAIARFLSVDPLTQEYPWYTPYQFAGNTPIAASDLDGKEIEFRFTDKNGVTVATKLMHTTQLKPIGEGMDNYNDYEVAYHNLEHIIVNVEWEKHTKTAAKKSLKENGQILRQRKAEQELAQHKANANNLIWNAYHVSPMPEFVSMADAIIEGNYGEAAVYGTIFLIPGEIDDAVSKTYSKSRIATNAAGSGPAAGKSGKGLEKLKNDINPTGNLFNCVDCAISFQKKITEKINLAAKSAKKGVENYAQTIRSAFPNTKMYRSLGGFSGLNKAIQQVKGNSAIIVGRYRAKYAKKNYNSHAFNGIKNKDGSWKFIDSQNGKQYTSKELEEYFGRFEIFDTIGL